MSASILPELIFARMDCVRAVKSRSTPAPVLAEVAKCGNLGWGGLEGALARSNLFPTSTISACSLELSCISASQASMVWRVLGLLRS